MGKGGKSWIVIAIVLVLISLIGYCSTSTDFDLDNGNVALIRVQGVILTTEAGFLSDVASSSSIVHLIEEAVSDKEIDAILIEINSPGGSAVASQEIGDAIKRVDKPVVSYIRDAGASGGYWVASATDYIFASPLSIVGSVGVNAAQLEFAGFIERYNITYRQQIAGEYKDLGSPFRTLTPTEERRLQEKLDVMHTYFINEVQTNRGLSDEVMEEVSKADFYVGVQAIDLGLIDAFGGQHEAVAYLEEQLDDDVTIIVYEPERSFADLLASLSAPRTISLENVELGLQ